MMAVATLARHTLLDALRERVFRLLFAFLIVLMAAAYLVKPLALGEGRRVTIDLGLTVLSLSGLLLIVMLGTRLLQKEVEHRTMLLLLARPVHRWQVLLGKFCGLLGVVGLVTIGMLAILAAVMWLAGYPVGSPLWAAGYFAFLELGILCAWSLLLTAFTSSALSGFFLIGLFVAGHLAPSLIETAALLPSAWARLLLTGTFRLLPRFDLYNRSLEVVHGLPAGAAETLWATVYALLYAAAALLMAYLLFRHREFS